MIRKAWGLLFCCALCAPSNALAERATYAVLTYNVAGLVAPAPMIFEYSAEERAGLIADRILAAQYDIVVIAEAFDDAVQDTLVARLSPSFPHFVKMLDDGGYDGDSGLMLFSKFPPRPLSRGASPSDWYCAYDPSTVGVEPAVPSGSVVTSPSFWTAAFADYAGCSAAYRPFSSLTDGDVWAAKGVGWVRVFNTVSMRPLNVFFTHPQASYADCVYECAVARAEGFAEIRAMIRTFAPLAEGEEAVLAGDLNVVGDLDAAGSRDVEYEREITSAVGSASLRALGFRDPWRADGTPSPAYRDDPLQRWRKTTGVCRRKVGQTGRGSWVGMAGSK
ncbi:MAG: hypothetical protein HYV63_23125 [Candidatus Schekmanbacteria bacterium]|nr:hypothetical protein [Candidatus Schekmanbacteria bacterium]